MTKPTTETVRCNGREVTINCFDVFAQGDCYAVTFDREGCDGINGHDVQALDVETGEPIAHDLTPEQHNRLGYVAEDRALEAIVARNWDCAMDAVS